jgi:preprotein translocase subunit YajC
MKKLIKTILVLAILAGVMLFTCPEEQKHVDKLTKEIVETVQKGQDNDDSGLLEEIGKVLVGTVSETVVKVYVKSQLKVENYYVLNVGKMYYDGEKRVVTIGAFNHVFCMVKAYDLLDEIK